MITIAIPAHNEENTIERNLTSVIRSKFFGRKYEIIVCLSACTDNTKARVKEFIKANPKVKVKIVNSPKIGKVRAYKTLDKVAKNKILVFLDADCGAQKDAIHRIFSKLAKAKD